MAWLRRGTKVQEHVVLYDIHCAYCNEEIRAPAGVVRCANCHGKLTVFPSEKPGQARVVQRQSIAGELERLARLHTQGVLSDESFAAAKQRVLQRH
jgi:predicted DCC family thiol-disulfide oxidoreductase YuxK